MTEPLVIVRVSEPGAIVQVGLSLFFAALLCATAAMKVVHFKRRFGKYPWGRFGD